MALLGNKPTDHLWISATNNKLVWLSQMPTEDIQVAMNRLKQFSMFNLLDGKKQNRLHPLWIKRFETELKYRERNK